MLGAAQTQREKGLVPKDHELVCCETVFWFGFVVLRSHLLCLRVNYLTHSPKTQQKRHNGEKHLGSRTAPKLLCECGRA